jgi:hypothetical protein
MSLASCWPTAARRMKRLPSISVRSRSNGMLLGPGHPEIATTLHNWALLAKATGQVEQARLLWAEAEATLNTRDATSTDGRPKDGIHE